MTGQERNYGFMKLSELTAYELLGEQELKDIHSMGYILRHKKSGARITVISNDDENKVFYIGFRTPPEDSTGVPHIIEHTVLCGSDKYPVKDPFVELVKGSLNTFFKCDHVPGEDHLSGGELQQCGFSEPDECLYGCGVSSGHLQAQRDL